VEEDFKTLVQIRENWSEITMIVVTRGLGMFRQFFGGKRELEHYVKESLLLITDPESDIKNR